MLAEMATLVDRKGAGQGLVADGEVPTTQTPAPGPSPLFLAQVDEVDTTAVLGLLAIVPATDGSGLRAFERKNGGWVEAPDVITQLNGIDPPPVVELDRESLLSVVEQMDSFDQKKLQEEGEAA